MRADRVREAVERPGPLLDAELARMLAGVGWRRMAAAGVERDGYSTSRALRPDAGSPIPSLATVAFPGLAESIRIETFGDGVPSRYADLGIDEADVSIDRLAAAVGSGLRLLSRHPPALATVASLARTLHPMRTEDPETDVSYSDPEVPFSIFVGVHGREVADEPARIAEGILHETMHLQLSLIEDVVPLVCGATERWNSPWQKRPRPAQGVLHGLYVFRAVEELLASIRDEPEVRAAYVGKRLASIREEIEEAAGFVGSLELTETGRILAHRLVAVE